MDAAADPLPDDDNVTLLQLVDERLAAVVIEEAGLRNLRTKLLARMNREDHDERAAA